MLEPSGRADVSQQDRPPRDPIPKYQPHRPPRPVGLLRLGELPVSTAWETIAFLALAYPGSVDMQKAARKFSPASILGESGDEENIREAGAGSPRQAVEDHRRSADFASAGGLRVSVKVTGFS